MKTMVMDPSGKLLFKLQDLLEHPLFWWPNTLVRYPVDFRKVIFRPEDLILTRQDTGEPVPFQLSGVEVDGDRLSFAYVSFFTDLPAGGTRLFELASAQSSSPRMLPMPEVKDRCEHDSIVVDTGAMQIRIPDSRPGSGEIPGPIMQANRGTGWIGSSRIVSRNRAVISVMTEKLESGPLFIIYRITYRFENCGIYKVDILCASGMDFVRVKEQMEGFSEEDGIFVKTAWPGLNPTHRQAAEHPYQNEYRSDGKGGYLAERIDEPLLRTHLGIYDSANAEGELPLRLGLFEPWPQFSILTSASFWNEHTGDTLGVFVDRSDEWRDREYALWTSSEASLVRFFYAEGCLYWKWPLVSGTRSVGLACYDHMRDVETTEHLKNQCKAAAGFRFSDGEPCPVNLEPVLFSRTMFLRSRYGTIDLDVIKDWVLDYPESSRRPPVIFDTGYCSTIEDLKRDTYDNGLVKLIPIHGTGATHSRMVYHSLVDGYNRLYPVMNPEQAKRFTAMYLFLAYHHAGEEYMPMKNMLSGHPNFLADVKSVPAHAAFLFPEHPMASQWRDLFGKFLELNTRYHTRPPVGKWHAKGGRWTENLGVYVWAFLRPVVRPVYLLKEYGDGKNRLATEHFARLGDWLVGALSSPFHGENMDEFNGPEFRRSDGTLQWVYWGIVKPEDAPRRVHVPQGAHASRRMPPRTMWLLGQYLMRYSPLLAEHLMWASKPQDDDVEHRRDELDAWGVMYAGKPDNRGTNPRLKSSKFTGYGVTLRAAVDTEHEVFIHLQQLDAGPNYRWGIAGEYGSGNLYFYAAGKAYSHNAWEDAGDRYAHDTDFTSTFGVWKRGEFRTIGTNVLHRPLHRLGAVQFAEIVPRQGANAFAWPEYTSRSVMLAGSDYFVLYDKVIDDTTRHRFSWFVRRGDRFPFIHFVKGGKEKTEVRTFETEGVWYDATGDSMAVITHKPGAQVQGTEYGCLIRLAESTDFIFQGRGEIDFQDAGIQFKGLQGLIRKFDQGRYELALFQGGSIGAGGVTVGLADPESGISASFIHPYELRGKYHGVTGGLLTLSFDDALEGPGCFYLDGEKQATKIEEKRVTVAMPAGEHEWQLTRGEPTPLAPRILYTENSSRQAKVVFTSSVGAGTYRIERSIDNGLSWQEAGATHRPEYELTGLENGTKLHVRAIACNAAGTSEPSDEYPVYVTDCPPPFPEGLQVRIEEGRAGISWGEVLGVTGYKLYRRVKGEVSYELIYSGKERVLVDERPDIVPACPDPDHPCPDRTFTVYEYAVSAVNGNGEGDVSVPEHTSPEGWLHWDPKPGEPFRRRYSSIYPGKPYSVFEFGIKPFAEAGYEQTAPIRDRGRITDEDDDESECYPD